MRRFAVLAARAASSRHPGADLHASGVQPPVTAPQHYSTPYLEPNL